jgi:hypothetical protein
MVSDIFDKIGHSDHVIQLELLNLANSVKGADFSNEETVRQLIKDISLIMNSPISKENEETIVSAITGGLIPLDFSTLAELFTYKK